MWLPRGPDQLKCYVYQPLLVLRSVRGEPILECVDGQGGTRHHETIDLVVVVRVGEQLKKRIAFAGEVGEDVAGCEEPGVSPVCRGDESGESIEVVPAHHKGRGGEELSETPYLECHPVSARDEEDQALPREFDDLLYQLFGVGLFLGLKDASGDALEVGYRQDGVRIPGVFCTSVNGESALLVELVQLSSVAANDVTDSGWFAALPRMDDGVIVFEERISAVRYFGRLFEQQTQDRHLQRRVHQACGVRTTRRLTQAYQYFVAAIRVLSETCLQQA